MERQGISAGFSRAVGKLGSNGYCIRLVYVAWPLQVQNGFLKTVRFGGEIAWIHFDFVRPPPCIAMDLNDFGEDISVLIDGAPQPP
jgi:hypothetical protein